MLGACKPMVRRTNIYLCSLALTCCGDLVTRCMLRDPVVYPEPHVFRPERFLESDKGPATQRDPAKIAFGFGRR